MAPPGYDVEVTPDGATTPNRPPASGPYTAVFVVRNNGSYNDTYTLNCWGSSNVSCTGLSKTSVYLKAWKQTNITATYSVGVAGPGVLNLMAESNYSDEISDVGYFNVPVVDTDEGPPVVALRNHDSEHRDLSLCFNINAEARAQIRCGELLVGHALPTYRTLGRDRALTLLYNSGTASPRPAIAVAVTIPPNLGVPDSLYAELTVQDVQKAKGTYSTWPAGQTRQIALAFDATTLASGLYPFQVLVRSHYPGGVYGTSIADTLLVVNRSGSEFGAGWYLAGVEQILPLSGNRLLRIGGDGSGIVYRTAGTNVWVASPGTYRDTISWNGSTYSRSLRHGVTISFDAQGRHIQTVTRTGQVTTFNWDGCGRLATIQVPPAGAPATTYTLTYTSCGGVIDGIMDPAGRVLDATISSGNLTGLMDPDSGTITYEYSSRRMTRQSDQRSMPWEYAHGWLHVSQFWHPMHATWDFEHTRIYPWDTQGLSFGLTSGLRTAVDTSQVRTKVDGPRWSLAGDDTTLVWVDRYGAPIKVIDPLGYVTTIARGGADGPPALPTRVVFADGRVVRAIYDARANLTAVHDDTHEGTGTVRTVSTSYEYDPDVKDSPRAIRSPVDTTLFLYDVALGLPVRARDQSGHVTRFIYETAGPLRGLVLNVMDSAVSVVNPSLWTKSSQNLVTQFQYDSWGNDTAVISPTGLRTRYVRDNVRRVDWVWDQGGHATDHAYDPMNRITAVTTFGTTNPLGDAATTQYQYSPTGQIETVTDQRGVQRHWTYDWGGRPIEMIDEAGLIERRSFDPASFLDTVWLRSGELVRHVYDAAGRNVQTIGSSRIVLGVTIPGVSIARGFDAMGRLVSAGGVSRVYNREGTLREERQVSGSLDFTARYRYDTGDRRAWFHNGIDSITYAYGTTGRLAKLKAWWATGFQPDSFLFGWDGLGRRDSLIYTNETRVGYGYDAEGHLRIVCSVHAPSVAVDDRLDHRLRYTSVDADGQVLTMEQRAGGGNQSDCALNPSSSDLIDNISSATYDGRHQVVTRHGLGGDWSYQYDLSGNLIYKQDGTSPATTFYVPSYSNRVAAEMHDGGTVYNFTHDPNGARLQQLPPPLQWGTHYCYYNTLGQMAGFGRYYQPDENLLWYDYPTVCKYDALGRRVNQCEPVSNAPTLGFDGENVVRGAGPEWRYVHGPGVDDPLVAVYKYAYNEYRRYYYVTDGRGRQLTFTNWDGVDFSDHLDYYQNGGNQAGGITQSHGFNHERANSPDVPHLSFYRNRYYDQESGRFMQEDPIGIAGGVDLYGYAGNNPINFTDPFGLKICPPDCGAIHAVSATAFGVLGALVGGTVGSTVPGGGTVIGATGGALAGSFFGIATVNVVTTGVEEMSTIGRKIGTVVITVATSLFGTHKQMPPSDPTQTGAGGQEVPVHAPAPTPPAIDTAEVKKPDPEKEKQ